MKIAERYLGASLQQDLKHKMVFLGGPRQAGKTTLALSMLSPATRENAGYLNWDIPEHRELIRRDSIPASPQLIVLDEVHKFKYWRRTVKGFYDRYYPERNCLVTGSARLDFYRRGGDSLVGRYHYFRLHPFSFSELDHPSAIEHLLQYGGFPEPFLKADQRFYRRWSAERLTRVVQDDINTLENVSDLSQMELLVDALPARVGSPLSVNSLAEDLERSQPTVKRWLEILSRVYVIFQVPPYHASKLRAVKKAPKLYLWDWAQVEDPGARFENMVASHLLKYCHFRQDTQGFRTDLYYLRDRDGREIDFLVCEARQPVFAVECKLAGQREAGQLLRFKERLRLPRAYQVHLGTLDTGCARKSVRILPFGKMCRELELV